MLHPIHFAAPWLASVKTAQSSPSSPSNIKSVQSFDNLYTFIFGSLEVLVMSKSPYSVQMRELEADLGLLQHLRWSALW